MVDQRALKVAAVVVGGAVALFVVSLVLRMVARILSLAVLVGLALAAGYAAYQLYEGWTDAERATGGIGSGAGDDTDVETLQERYASGELSEAELEAELEDAVDPADSTGDRERERER